MGRLFFDREKFKLTFFTDYSPGLSTRGIVITVNAPLIIGGVCVGELLSPSLRFTERHAEEKMPFF